MQTYLDKITSESNCRQCGNKPIAFFNSDAKCFLCSSCVGLYCLDQNYLITSLLFKNKILFADGLHKDIAELSNSISEMFDRQIATLAELKY